MPFSGGMSRPRTVQNGRVRGGRDKERDRKTKRWTEPTIEPKQSVAGDETKTRETVTVGNKKGIDEGKTEKIQQTEQQGRVRGEDRVRQLILCHGCAN